MTHQCYGSIGDEQALALYLLAVDQDFPLKTGVQPEEPQDRLYCQRRQAW